jgi:hypothetical protein
MVEAFCISTKQAALCCASLQAQSEFTEETLAQSLLQAALVQPPRGSN